MTSTPPPAPSTSCIFFPAAHSCGGLATRYLYHTLYRPTRAPPPPCSSQGSHGAGRRPPSLKQVAVVLCDLVRELLCLRGHLHAQRATSRPRPENTHRLRAQRRKHVTAPGGARPGARGDGVAGRGAPSGSDTFLTSSSHAAPRTLSRRDTGSSPTNSTCAAPRVGENGSEGLGGVGR